MADTETRQQQAERLRDAARDLVHDAASWRDAADRVGGLVAGNLTRDALENERRATELEAAAEAIESLLADLAASEQARAEMQQPWQPMETAPRPTSGRRKVINVWAVTDDHASAEFYFGASMCGVAGHMLWQGRVNDVYWWEGAWRPVSGLVRHALTVTPTHWMYPPSAPQAEQALAHARIAPQEKE